MVILYILITLKNVSKESGNIGYIAISENSLDIKAAIEERKNFILRTAILVAIVILIFSVVLNRYFLKPIKNLVDYTKIIKSKSKKETKIELIKNRNDELGVLSKSLDGFSGAIIQNFVYGLQNPPDIFNRNKKGIERVETILNLDFKGELAPQFNFKIGGNFRYDWGKWKNNKFQTNENSTKFNIKDFYLDYYPSSQIWLRIGNQIIARGQLDNLSITDTINPRDLSIPGQGELSEIRQQVPAILLNFPISDLKVELVVTSRAGGNLMGEKGGSFDPTIPF